MKIKIYGADWCSDCVNLKNFLNSRGIQFEYVVITENKEAISIVEAVNKGKRIIPTIDIDGQIYSNPGINKVMKIIEK